jgi:hypothetical protein
MLTYSKETKITKDQTLGMDFNEFIRWGCLIEAIELVEDKAKMLNIDIDDNADWIKPVDFKKYIRERFDSLKDEIIVQVK